MESSFPVAHRRMLVYEGGYSNHPSDPGGVTLEGVTQAVYDTYRRSKGLQTRSLGTLRLSYKSNSGWRSERDDIYRSRYWLPPRCHVLPSGVDAAIYDYSVNSGIGRSRKVLQRLVGVPVDGEIGPVTLAAVAKRDPRALVQAICDERLAFLQRLSTWPVFGKGWGRRVADVRSYAGALASTAVASPVPRNIPDQGKGEVPDPKAAKNAVKVGVPGAGAAAGGGFFEWVMSHPIEAGLIGLIVIGITVLAVYALNRWRRNKQEAAVPGIGVVPERIT